jgi:hypothetical protein
LFSSKCKQRANDALQVKQMLARRRSRGAGRIRIINRVNWFQKNASFNEVLLLAQRQMKSPELKVYDRVYLSSQFGN